MLLDARAERQCFLLRGVHVRFRTAEVHSPGQLSPILLFEIRARNWRYFFTPIRLSRDADCDSVRGTSLQQCHRCGCSRVLSGDRSLQDHGCINVFRHGIPCDKQIPAPTEEANSQRRENTDQPQLPVRPLARFLILGNVDKCVSQCASPAKDKGRKARKKPSTHVAHGPSLTGSCVRMKQMAARVSCCANPQHAPPVQSKSGN